MTKVKFKLEGKINSNKNGKAFHSSMGHNLAFSLQRQLPAAAQLARPGARARRSAATSAWRSPTYQPRGSPVPLPPPASLPLCAAFSPPRTGAHASRVWASPAGRNHLRPLLRRGPATPPSLRAKSRPALEDSGAARLDPAVHGRRGMRGVYPVLLMAAEP